jgi:hypothetical protein
MQIIHCGSVTFPYQVLERRLAQETLKGCAEELNIHPA